MADSNGKQPRNGYGESSAEDVNKSGYRYPASHFVPPVPLEDAEGGEETRVSPVAPRRRTKNKSGPVENKTHPANR